MEGRPGVPDLQVDRPTLGPGAEHEVAAGNAGGDAVLDGVFHQGLEEQGGHFDRVQILIPLPDHPEPVLQADGFQGQEVRNDLALFSEGQPHVLGSAHDTPEQVREMPDGALGRLGVLIDEFRQAVERIEQHVGVDLALEEAVLGHLGLGFEGLPEFFGMSPCCDQSPHDHHGRTHQGGVEAQDSTQIELKSSMSEYPGIKEGERGCN